MESCSLATLLSILESHACQRIWASSVRAVDINPNGRSYASGAEDGYVRLHIFDQDYLDMKDPVPEEDEEEDDDEEEEENPAAQ